MTAAGVAHSRAAGRNTQSANQTPNTARRAPPTAKPPATRPRWVAGVARRKPMKPKIALHVPPIALMPAAKAWMTWPPLANRPHISGGGAGVQHRTGLPRGEDKRAEVRFRAASQVRLMFRFLGRPPSEVVGPGRKAGVRESSKAEPRDGGRGYGDGAGSLTLAYLRSGAFRPAKRGRGRAAHFV